MFFNSLDFAFFLPVVFILYWFIANKKLQVQNILMLVASYFFYACWDYRFLFLLIFSTFLDYYTGIRINEASKDNNRKFWLWLSIGINLGFLGVFKYYNFFAESFGTALSSLGIRTNFWTIKVILPVGISFYTFHGLSYVIDIYKRRIQPDRNFIDYSVFVSFFPLLVAGPIERATHLLPQIKRKRQFNYTEAVEGLRQILWGLFKKVVIADNCAEFVNTAFGHPEQFHGSTLILGAVLFAIQIYCDFSGYSDIALGTAKLFGINLLRNFAFPYFSRDIAEFWRRWHISLSSWFRDYLYIPLGGSKAGFVAKIRNTFIIFLVSGFWHGANWTFIVWGALNAIYFLPLLLLNRNRANLEIVAAGKWLPSLKDFFNIILTFGLTVFAWIFFRSENMHAAINYVSKIFSKSILSLPEKMLFNTSNNPPLAILGCVCFFIIVEWFGREKQFALSYFAVNRNRIFSWSFYSFLILLIVAFSGKGQQFIYFQF